MNLRFITCSDARENLSPVQVVDLLKISPLAELGVQAHAPRMSYGEPRYTWMQRVCEVAKISRTPVNIAIHVNFTWCNDICVGIVPSEINSLLRHKNSYTFQPVVSRIQLNIDENTKMFDAEKLAKIIKGWKKFEVILPFNKITKPHIEELKKTGAQFSLLFDGSYGAGILPEKWDKPAYNDIAFGYAGGLSPDNVKENLDKISQILPTNYDTWIDAEGQLRDRYGAMDISLARDYLNNALDWYKQHSK